MCWSCQGTFLLAHLEITLLYAHLVSPLLKAWYFIQNIVYRPLQCCRWRCSKDFDLGRYVVSFHFYFIILGSHMLVAWFQDSSKTPCEIAVPKNWAPENSLKNHHSCKTWLVTLSSFHAVLTIVSNQSNHNVVPLILATFLTICKEVIWWWESMLVELSNCCWVLATFLTSCKEVFDSVFLSCSWVIIIEFCHHLGYLIKKSSWSWTIVVEFCGLFDNT